MARQSSRTLTEVELEFMQIVWDRGEVTTEGVQDALEEQGRSLTGGSVRKMLGILVEKGYLTRRKEGRGFVYSPEVNAERATRSMVSDLLDRAFDGSPADMVAALLDCRSVRPGDVQRIRQLIAEREQEDET